MPALSLLVVSQWLGEAPVSAEWLLIDGNGKVNVYVDGRPKRNVGGISLEICVREEVMGQWGCGCAASRRRARSPAFPAFRKLTLVMFAAPGAYPRVGV